MILFDRFLRFIKGDIFLPKKCNATFLKQMKLCKSCKCKVFCRRLPNRATLSPIMIDIKNKRM